MPDCVIADIMMTPMNGIELTHIIRSDSRIIRHDVPIILVTGHSDTTNVRLARKLDVHGFVAKPVSRATLTRRIEAALTTKKSVKPRRHYTGITLPHDPMSSPDGNQARRKHVGERREAFTPTYKADQAGGQERSGTSSAGRAPRGKARSGTKPLHPSSVRSLEDVSVGAILATDVVTSNGVRLMSQGEPLSEPRLKKLRGLADAHPEIRRIRITTA